MFKKLIVLVSALFVVLCLPVRADEGEKFEFQAEVSRMMDIIINSLYQKKEVFLREVISNGADALDKIRFIGLQNPEELDSYKDLEMRISFDEEEKTLTIRDSGVGMTRQELIENLGTVAKSGTTNFIEQLANSGDLSLIGQFGVGFYSVYLVSDRVQVRTKSNKDDQYIWESTADSTFTVKKDDGESLGRGTEIKMFLKEDALEYANGYRLTHLVERYSEFIGFPIYVYKEVTVEEEDEEGSEDEEDLVDDEEDEDSDEDEEEDEEDEAPKKVWKWVLVNSQKAIWTRSPSEIEDQEYEAFYQALTKTSGTPLTWTHFRAEGEVEFKSILYIPSKAPYNQYDQYYNIDSMLKLYVRKVLIKDDFENLLPRYLNFIKGVVDSDDLPLSVSRETLQQAKAITVIGKKLTRKALDMLQKMANKEIPEDDEEEDEDDIEEEVEETNNARYQDFYEKFGKNIKLGLVEDATNRERLTKLLRYKTTKTESGDVFAPGGMTSLDAYVKRMKPWQKSIYYITGEDVDSLLTSPFLKKANSKDIEVILMGDPVDEYVLQHLKKYEGFALQSLAKDGVKFGDETEDDKRIEEEYKLQFKDLGKWLKSTFNDEDNGGRKDMINKVVVSTSTIDENIPAVVVSARYGNSATMERLMMSQALGDVAKETIARATKIMEINPRSPIIAKLKEIYQSEEGQARDIAWLLLDTALVASGFDINEKPEFASRMFRLMKTGLKLESLDPLPMIPVPEPVEEDEVDEEADDLDEKEEL